MRLSIVLCIIKLLAVTYTWSQADSSWNVLLLKKGMPLIENKNTSQINAHGFYLFENCIYNITLENKVTLNGRLIKVGKDSLSFTNFLNATVAKKNFSQLDTVTVSYLDLKTLTVGESTRYKLDEYDFIFKKDTGRRYIPSEFVKLYLNDTLKYELVPILFYNGMASVYELNGKMFWYEGVTRLIKPIKKSNPSPYKTRNFLWFTPGRVEEINGLAVGLWAENSKNDEANERDSIKVNGVNIEINPIMLFVLIRNPWTNIYPDSIGYYYSTVEKNYSTKLNGLNLSLLGSAGSYQVNGLSIGGINTAVDRVNGIAISGFNNFAYILNGISIAAIRNRATLARGLQIGLFNKATELRGLQIGIWNSNGKRSMPLINWQFKPKKK